MATMAWCGACGKLLSHFGVCYRGRIDNKSPLSTDLFIDPLQIFGLCRWLRPRSGARLLLFREGFFGVVRRTLGRLYEERQLRCSGR